MRKHVFAGRNTQQFINYVTQSGERGLALVLRYDTVGKKNGLFGFKGDGGRSNFDQIGVM